ncbi:hypothetical protein [Spirillospora sp. NPDC048824]|uniref:hypothetical protein n=1 Tax=Spirillospora sp. NPDC048824 TaxID=3364526 RepID=UPI003711B444
MGSLLDELARREAGVRQRIEELREEIAGLESRLEAEEDRLSRLVITRETVEEILGGAAPVAVAAGEEGEAVEPVEPVDAASLVRGVVTVPPWRPGMSVRVLPQAYRDAVEIMADAGGAMRAGQILVAMGLADGAAKREGLRSKLKRLVERGWAAEDGPGLFTVTAPVAGDLADGTGRGAGGGIAS